MIDINLLYQRVNVDIARLNKSGYDSNEEFNRNVNHAQIVIMNYYHRIYESEQHVSDAVVPFKKEVILTVSSGQATLPTDFRHRLSIWHDYVINGECKGEVAKSRKVPMPSLRSNQRSHMLSGGIYEPSLKRGVAYHELFDGYAKVFPASTPSISLVYLRKPEDALRATTLNEVTEQMDYDASNSVHLEWPEQELGNFVSLLMFFKGISVKETALIQFAAQSSSVTNTFI